jgi:hypothetical protein
MLVFRPLVSATIARWAANPVYSRSVVVTVGAAVAAGAIWKIFHSIRLARVLFIGGLVVGVTLLVMR